jgi:nuclear pore complex protein Nup133
MTSMSILSPFCVLFLTVTLSWDSIRQTVDVTDFELNNKFRNTALYAALRSAPTYILEPQQALNVPSTTEISSRWPGMPPEQVEAMESDYRVESERLRTLSLENDFSRVGELAAADAME